MPFASSDFSRQSRCFCMTSPGPSLQLMPKSQHDQYICLSQYCRLGWTHDAQQHLEMRVVQGLWIQDRPLFKYQITTRILQLKFNRGLSFPKVEALSPNSNPTKPDKQWQTKTTHFNFAFNHGAMHRPVASQYWNPRQAVIYRGTNWAVHNDLVEDLLSSFTWGHGCCSSDACCFGL